MMEILLGLGPALVGIIVVVTMLGILGTLVWFIKGINKAKKTT